MTSSTAHIGNLQAATAVERLDAGGVASAVAEAIARTAAGLVQPGSAIGISAGPISCAFARRLAGISDLTIVTNSPPVANTLHGASRLRQTVILTGGIRTACDALVGPVATEAIRDLHMDCVFISAHGVHAQSGFTSACLAEAEANRALTANARRLVVLADHTRWGLVGQAEFARLNEAAALVSDDGLADEPRRVLEESVGTLVLASRT